MKKFLFLIDVLWHSILLVLPGTYHFCKMRVNYYRNKGAIIGNNTSISPNVRIIGKFVMGEGSSIAQNSSISGGSMGVFIGKNVMVAPNVVIVALNHRHDNVDVPMVKQGYVESQIIIEDDVWIAANCTIAAGVKVGKGSIVAANSCVTKEVEPYSIVGGVPAKLISNRV